MEYVLRYKLLSTLVTTAHGDVRQLDRFLTFAYSIAIKRLRCIHTVSFRYGEAGAAILYHAAGQDRETNSTQCEHPSANPGDLSLSLSLLLMM